MNVLITSASRKVSLIKSFQEALALEGGGRVIAADVSARSAALYVADDSYIVPRSDAPGFIDAIIDLCENCKVTLVVPTRDEELSIFADAKAKLLNFGVHVMVADATVINLCQNKRLFSEFCIAEGLFVPRSYACVADVADEDLPVFVRAVRGKGSSGAWIAELKSELKSLVNKNGEFLIQEFVDAPEYTVDLFSDLECRIISVVVREREHTFGGESFVSRTVKSEQITKEAVLLARSLHLIGHNTLQCFLCGGDVKWIEVNPRYGGGASLGFEVGAFTPQYLIKTVLGEYVDEVVGDYEEGVTMLRYTQDLFLRANELREGRVDASSIV